jgi:CRISPR/Cas system-associated protein endoribonuclease Cas2
MSAAIAARKGGKIMKQFLVKQGLCMAVFVLSFFVVSHLMAQSPLSIRLSTHAPAKGKIELNVLSGDYKLKSGTELWIGSKLFVYEDQMTFPTGLLINVGKGGVTLRGKSYPEGATLTVGKDGAFLLMK